MSDLLWVMALLSCPIYLASIYVLFCQNIYLVSISVLFCWNIYLASISVLSKYLLSQCSCSVLLKYLSRQYLCSVLSKYLYCQYFCSVKISISPVLASTAVFLFCSVKISISPVFLFCQNIYFASYFCSVLSKYNVVFLHWNIWITPFLKVLLMAKTFRQRLSINPCVLFKEINVKQSVPSEPNNKWEILPSSSSWSWSWWPSIVFWLVPCVRLHCLPLVISVKYFPLQTIFHHHHMTNCDNHTRSSYDHWPPPL